MPSLAFRITGQYKPTNDAAIRASLRDAFAPGAIEDDVECPDTHRIVAIRGTFADTQTMVGGGTFAVRGRFSTSGDVGGCETGKALRRYFMQTAEGSVGQRTLIGRPTVALAAMPAGVRNPSRKRKAAKRRNPARKPVARAPLTYDAVAVMGAAEINKRLDALDRESSAITDEFIATGRGYERPSERRHKTDPLSLRDAQNAHDRYVLHAEIARRYGPGAPSRLPTRAARTIRARNPSKSSAASRRRNPAPKPRTYAVARADILRALRADGWDVRENLKVPHATHPSGDFRLWFKTQAIYFTTGDRRRGQGSLSDARSLWIGDIRAMPVAEVLADIERSRRSSTQPHQNPSPRQNESWRRHHESAAVQAGVVRKDYALAAHHYAEVAKYVADKPRLVAYYRKEAEKYRSLAETGR